MKLTRTLTQLEYVFHGIKSALEVKTSGAFFVLQFYAGRRLRRLKFVGSRQFDSESLRVVGKFSCDGGSGSARVDAVCKQMRDVVNVLRGWYPTSVLAEPEFRAREAEYRRIEAHLAEVDQIIEKAVDNETHLKAPNGNPTNLTAYQWALVRTKEFKEYSGDDWEHAAKVKKLQNSDPIRFTGNEWEEGKIRSGVANKYVLNSLRFDEGKKRHVYTNKDTGSEIIVSRSTSEVASHGGDVYLKTVALIPQIIEESIFLGEGANEKDKRGFDSFRYYAARLRISDTDYVVRLTTGVANIEVLYDISLTEIKKRAAAPDQRDLITNQVYDWEATLSETKDDRLPQLLQVDCSKFSNTIDENGEPNVAEVEAFERKCAGILQLHPLSWIKQSDEVYGWFNPNTGKIVLREGCTVSIALEAFWLATLHLAKTTAPRLYRKMLVLAEVATKHTKYTLKKLYPGPKTGSKAWLERLSAMQFAIDYTSEIEKSLNDSKEGIEVSPVFSENELYIKELAKLQSEKIAPTIAKALARGKRLG